MLAEQQGNRTGRAEGMDDKLDEVLRKLEELRQKACDQKKNWWNRRSHHDEVEKEVQALRDVLASLKADGKQDRDALKKRCDALEKKRAEGYGHAHGAAEHLERVDFLDGWGGQALALVKLARKVLEPLA